MHALEMDYPVTEIAEFVCWRALNAKSGSERRACVWLRKHGLQPYWPRYRVEPTRDVKIRSHVRWRSVIPGKIFLPIPPWRSITSDFFEYAPGIYGFMRSAGGNVVEIVPKDIEMIRGIEEAWQASAIAAVYGIPFKIGQKIRLRKYEVEGKILRIEGRRRIFVETALFSGAPIEAPIEELEAV